MRNFSLFLLLVFFPSEVTSTKWKIKGKLTCKDANGEIKPMAKQKVALKEWDRWGDDPDDNLGDAFTNEEGFYQVTGEQSEFWFGEEPFLNIFHTCGGDKAKGECFFYETTLHFYYLPGEQTIDIELGKEQNAKLDGKSSSNLKIYLSQSKAIPCPEVEQKEKAKHYNYNDTLTRQKFWPIAAAAYGEGEQIKKCILKIWGLDRQDAAKIEFIKLHGANFEPQHMPLIGVQLTPAYNGSMFVLVSHIDKAIILSFRGCDDLMRLIVMLAPDYSVQSPPKGTVNVNLVRLWNLLNGNNIILDFVDDLYKKYPKYEIWLTGHSIGGSVAAIAAGAFTNLLKFAPERVKLVTFGEPRTGDEEWAHSLDKELPFYNYRVVHQYDLIPRIPRKEVPVLFKGIVYILANLPIIATQLSGIFDYQHHKYEVFYDNDMGPNDEFIVCEDEDQNGCSEFAEWKYWSDVMWYYTSAKPFTKLMDQHSKYFGFGKRVAEYGRAGCV